MMIDSYQFGSISVGGKTYNSDLIIYPDKVDSNWWRKEGHVLHNQDIKDVLDQRPEVLVVGTGAHGVLKVSQEVIDTASTLGIELFIAKTDAACEHYNGLEKSGKKAVAALHLTC